jgi:hypothetical protein
LTNVTIAGNLSITAGYGCGIYNDFEGHAERGQLRDSVLNVLLTNTRVTGNQGGGIYNHYWRFSGRGINLTLDNSTIADNGSSIAGAGGVYSLKGTDHLNATFGDGFYDESAPNKRTFPVTVRYRNSVVFHDSASASPVSGVWAIAGSYPGFFDVATGTIIGQVNKTSSGLEAMLQSSANDLKNWLDGEVLTLKGSAAAAGDTVLDKGRSDPFPPPSKTNGIHAWRKMANGYWTFTGETWQASLVGGIHLSGMGNLDGTTVTPKFANSVAPGQNAGGDYRPAGGSALAGAANSSLYPNDSSVSPNNNTVLHQCFWYGGTYNPSLESIFTGGILLYFNSTRSACLIGVFLSYDNSFNIGDLRDNGGGEGPKNKSRMSPVYIPSGSMSIGAYEP